MAAAKVPLVEGSALHTHRRTGLSLYREGTAVEALAWAEEAIRGAPGLARTVMARGESFRTNARLLARGGAWLLARPNDLWREHLLPMVSRVWSTCEDWSPVVFRSAMCGFDILLIRLTRSGSETAGFNGRLKTTASERLA